MPESAQVAFARRRGSVAAPGRRATGIATCDGRAVERRVERVLVQLEPAAERLPGAAAPRQALFAFDDAGRLSVQVRTLVRERRSHGQRLEREACLDARATAREIALQRRKRSIR